MGSPSVSAAAQGQYAMWNLSAANQSCAMSQYSPYIRTTAPYTLPPTPDTPGISTMSDTTLASYDTHQAALAAHASHSQNEVTSAAMFSTQTGRELKPSWNVLTPP
jgi:hypothetical protein